MKKYSVREAWDKFPELRDRYELRELESEYRAIVLRKADDGTEWLEGEYGFLDQPQYDVLVEWV